MANRTTGPDRGGDGPDQRRHEGSREEPDGDGEVLWPLCPPLQQVSVLSARLCFFAGTGAGDSPAQVEKFVPKQGSENVIEISFCNVERKS